MMQNIPHKAKRVGFVSVRLAGTDGVSLETAKWDRVFVEEGLKCYYFAGELDRPKSRSYLSELAHFTHPRIRRITERCFNTPFRPSSVTREIHLLKRQLKSDLYAFIKKFKIDILVPENALAIPINIPLGIAITEVVAECGIPTIAHGHDFYWERKRFLRNAIGDYLNMAFPAVLPAIHHAVISSYAEATLSFRTGISAEVVPNVMAFETPPEPPDAYTKTVRRDLGIAADELFVLQPTRVVQRKGIEHAIELVSRLKMKAKLVISHASLDEGPAYEKRIREYAKMMKVDTIFVAGQIGDQRGKSADGRKIYTLDDVYHHADLITYPSTYEGFGNAFLEAVYHKKPIVVNNYSIYATDIKPKGFRVIEFDEFITDATVRQTRRVLKDASLRRSMAEHNYRLGARHFSFTVLRQKLRALLLDCEYTGAAGGTAVGSDG